MAKAPSTVVPAIPQARTALSAIERLCARTPPSKKNAAGWANTDCHTKCARSSGSPFAPLDMLANCANMAGIASCLQGSVGLNGHFCPAMSGDYKGWEEGGMTVGGCHDPSTGWKRRSTALVCGALPSVVSRSPLFRSSTSAMRATKEPAESCAAANAAVSTMAIAAPAAIAAARDASPNSEFMVTEPLTNGIMANEEMVRRTSFASYDVPLFTFHDTVANMSIKSPWRLRCRSALLSGRDVGSSNASSPCGRTSGATVGNGVRVDADVSHVINGNVASGEQTGSFRRRCTSCAYEVLPAAATKITQVVSVARLK